jgi:uncharacterized DUF497 family protein
MYCMIMYNVMDGFDWDRGNKTKNWAKHKVNTKECEELFFNRPVIIYRDIRHSRRENRFGILGKTNKQRLLCLIFTVRKEKIRVISARDQNKKERTKYEKREKTA